MWFHCDLKASLKFLFQMTFEKLGMNFLSNLKSLWTKTVFWRRGEFLAADRGKSNLGLIHIRHQPKVGGRVLTNIVSFKA